MTHDTPRENAYERLRAEVLISGLSDWVSLAEVQQIISHFELADTERARQDLVLRTIRSLLDDGLMQIGELPGPDGKFPAWRRSMWPWTVCVSAASANRPSRHRGTTRYGWA
jgi:hypothetical protein